MIIGQWHRLATQPQRANKRQLQRLRDQRSGLDLFRFQGLGIMAVDGSGSRIGWHRLTAEWTQACKTAETAAASNKTVTGFRDQGMDV